MKDAIWQRTLQPARGDQEAFRKHFERGNSHVRRSTDGSQNSTITPAYNVAYQLQLYTRNR